MSTRTSLDIAAAAAKTASPEHRRFQGLLAKIERARGRLTAWQRELPLFAQMHEQKAAPLLEALRVERRVLAFELEAAQGAQRWSKLDRATLSQMICGLCGALLDSSDEGDAELKALYDRHSEIGFDEEEQLHLSSMKAMLEKMGGVDLGEEPVASVEELMRRAHARMAQQAAAVEGGEAQRRPKRKPAAQKRAEADEQRVSQTVREVYRKLASALHPDRLAVDAAPEERAEQTALMQRANAAYETIDLLALLTLQLQIEQVDIAHAAGIAAEQVRHFNKVLAEQLRELEAEIDERQQAFCAHYGLLTEQRIDPTKLGALLKDELRAMAAAQAHVNHDRRLLRGDAAGIKRWLALWRSEQRAAEYADPF